VVAGLHAVMRGVGNEAAMLVEQLNARFPSDEFGRVRLDEVRSLTACCVSRCDVAGRNSIAPVATVDGFRSRLVACAVDAWGEER